MNILKSNLPCNKNPIFNTAIQLNKRLFPNPQNLTNTELIALRNFKGLNARNINNKIINGKNLSSREAELVDYIDSAFEKLNNYIGNSYRVLSFDNRNSFDNFINQFKTGENINFPSYTFTSTDYEGLQKHSVTSPYKAMLRINSNRGKDLRDYYGKDEIIFPRNTNFKVVNTLLNKINDNSEIFYGLLED